MRNSPRCFSSRAEILLSLFVLVTGLVGADYEFIRTQCEQKCPLKNHTVDDVGCGLRCYTDQCNQGCGLWERALQSSCETVCNGTYKLLLPETIPCIISCYEAVGEYSQHIGREIGTPPAPALVADSVTATSVSLEWDFITSQEQYPGVRYVVQCRFEDPNPGLVAMSWQYCRNGTSNDEKVFLIEELQPYTKYRFRMAVLLPQYHNKQVTVSEPSVVIITRASGLPEAAPTAVRAVAIDCARVSVSWGPSPFPHGPILSYVLHITENHPNGYSTIKEIPSSDLNYIFNNLEPLKNYSVSVSTRNEIGLGPAATVYVSTPAKREVKEIQQPILILGAKHSVIQQSVNMDSPVVLYETTHSIRGVAIHVRKNLLFISQSNGSVQRSSLSAYSNTSTVIVSPSEINYQPLDLSIDWLNNQLYILGEMTHSSKTWQVSRCDLDGNKQTVAVAGLMNKPNHIEVDPYNGYLFWAVMAENRGELYRLDLADISNGIKHDVRPELIRSSPHMGVFTVDPKNLRIFVIDNFKNTVNSTTLDGRDSQNYRSNVQTPMFQNTLSFSMANEQFYCTSGNLVISEEYHAVKKSYFHNAYADTFGSPFFSLLVNMPDCQPIPAPMNPPTQVQAVLSPSLAKASWQVPHLLGGQGRGAWQNWLYTIQIMDENEGWSQNYTNISGTTYVIQDVKENTEYVIKAAAYTAAGGSSWSSEFHGKSLHAPIDGKQISILWSATEGLLISNVMGENVQTLIPKSSMQDYHVTDIAWFQDQLYLLTSALQVYMYDLRSHKQEKLAAIDSVGSIAVDWIGKKLYWSSNSMIVRSNLNGSQQESLKMMYPIAKELNVDAVNAYMYWSTGYEVQCARLNGDDQFSYHKDMSTFYGKQVNGLTLDVDREMVYWTVGREDSVLYRDRMAQHLPVPGSPNPERISSLQKPNMQGPLCYFSDHLLWLQDDKNGIIGDMNGQNVAVVSDTSLSGLAMVAVMDPAMRSWHGKNGMKINVLPDPVAVDSIQIKGICTNFNITWQPVRNVNHGEVFYEIKVDKYTNANLTRKIKESTIKFWQEIAPYQPLSITIKAFTYWGTASPVKVRLYSPPSVPSAPRNPRCFVVYKHKPFSDPDISIVFRWNPPEYANGIIQGYRIGCQYMNNGTAVVDVCRNVEVEPTRFEYILENVMDRELYAFHVQAFTTVGASPSSQSVTVDTQRERPIPQVLLAEHGSIFLDDLDNNENQTLINLFSNPIAINYYWYERKVFWVTENYEVYVGSVPGGTKTKLDVSEDEVNSLTVDWVSRSIYYVNKNTETGLSSIIHLLLDEAGDKVLDKKSVLTTLRPVGKIEVSPFTNSLYWNERDENGTFVLKTCRGECSYIKNFFQQRSTDPTCNCSTQSRTECNRFMVRHSTFSEPEIIIFEENARNITVSDYSGCNCRSEVFTETDNIDIIMNTNTVISYGSHLQPYPPEECLEPVQEPLLLAVDKLMSTSLNLRMPDPVFMSACTRYAVATMKYTVYYSRHDEPNGLECDTMKSNKTDTYNKNLQVDGLKPYTQYIFCVALSNYYTELNNSTVIVGPGVLIKTATGAPSQPRNVTATVLSPVEVQVAWLPPAELNGETTQYEIYWKMPTTVNGVRQGDKPVGDPESDGSDYKRVTLDSLYANQVYSIWVRAYSQDATNYVDSDSVEIKTYPEPCNMTLIYRTPYSLCVQWEVTSYINRYVMQYRNARDNTWISPDNSKPEESNGFVNITVENLSPKTVYVFQVLLYYPNSNDPYVWPKDNEFSFETMGDVPMKPLPPKIQHVRNDVYQIWWESPIDNGAPIISYNLEGRSSPLASPLRRIRRSVGQNRTTAWFLTAPSVEEKEEEWISYYNGSDSYWIIQGLNSNLHYTFRVSAQNSYGWSKPSDESGVFNSDSAAKVAKRQEQLGVILGTSIPIIVIIIICIVVSVIYVLLKKKDKKTMLANVLNQLLTRDVELATLRDLPHWDWENIVHNINTLYSSALPTTEELLSLPQINRDQITLKNFLGSGAFGEVYEGIARGVGSNGSEIKVAVKTLRKGANEQEKLEFLKEAQLMSHFKHEHILQLLGVCLDQQFIIMELMQGGDLLTYLRTNRQPATPSAALTLKDLLSMCVDVARGCRYLEEMHFVHRDLACRNCLVSSTDRQTRVVKIGDFGLARDIYKNDYYRKEGEGLLPVRWMAPESLVDGVFTCQSDVWAFGVLTWEIMTLGQQPYPARNNLEVLHYVKDGGRLERPRNCSEELYQLMMLCWSYQPDNRPTFKYCLQVLEILSGSADNQHPAKPDGVCTVATNNGSSWKTNDSGNNDRAPFLPSNTSTTTEAPKYLEVLRDSDCSVTTTSDGYEVPRTDLNAQNTSENHTMRNSDVKNPNNVS